MQVAARNNAPSVLILGGGGIGRGLVGRVVSEAGMQPVLVDVVEDLVQRLRAAGQYSVHLVGTGRDVRTVTGYRVHAASEAGAVDEAVSACAFAATAVGGPHLEAAGSMLARGLMRRTVPLNILVCENWPHAESTLAERLNALGVPSHLFSCIRCSVEPMTVAMQGSLDLLQEEGQSLFVDAKAWLGEQPRIEGMVLTDNIDAFYARKLYTNNAGHALLAYEGALQGCAFIHEALSIPEIRAHLAELLDGASQVMVRHYGLPAQDVRKHVQSLVSVRFANLELSDPIARVARDPLRKLGPNERLIGLIRLLERYHLPTEPVSRVIGAALHYRHPEDPASMKLEEMMRQGGPESVLASVCGLGPEDACYAECLRHYTGWAR